MNKNKLKVFELIIDDNNDTEVNKISLVESPAIDVDFVKFSTMDDLRQFKFKVENADKRILTGPFMIPDQKIYRNEKDSMGNIIDEYYVIMSKDTIEKAVKKFFKNNYSSNINQQHSTDVDGAYLIESWLVSGKNDKSKNYGFDLPEGTWFGSVYIENEKFWNDYIKSGNLNLRGFSVEGLFNKSNIPVKEDFNKEDIDENIMKLAEMFIDFINKK